MEGQGSLKILKCRMICFYVFLKCRSRHRHRKHTHYPSHRHPISLEHASEIDEIEQALHGLRSWKPLGGDSTSACHYTSLCLALKYLAIWIHVHLQIKKILYILNLYNIIFWLSFYTRDLLFYIFYFYFIIYMTFTTDRTH